jgi:hypothetical protein
MEQAYPVQSRTHCMHVSPSSVLILSSHCSTMFFTLGTKSHCRVINTSSYLEGFRVQVWDCVLTEDFRLFHQHLERNIGIDSNLNSP